MSLCRLSASRGDTIIIIIIIIISIIISINFTMMTMSLVIMILMVTFPTRRVILNEYDHHHHHITCDVILATEQCGDLILLARYALKKELDSKNNSESMYQLGNLALSIQVRVIAF